MITKIVSVAFMLMVIYGLNEKKKNNELKTSNEQLIKQHEEELRRIEEENVKALMEREETLREEFQKILEKVESDKNEISTWPEKNILVELYYLLSLWPQKYDELQKQLIKITRLLLTSKNAGKPIDEDKFEKIIKDNIYILRKNVPRIMDIQVEGTKINVTALNYQKNTEWHFSLDFNDHGEITGKYRIERGEENAESSLPQRFAEEVEKTLFWNLA